MNLQKSPNSIDSSELAVASFKAMQYLLQSIEAYRSEISTLSAKIDGLVTEVSDLKLANQAVIQSPKLKGDTNRTFKYGEQRAVVTKEDGTKELQFVYSILSKTALIWKDNISTDPPNGSDLRSYSKSSYELI